MQTLKEMSLAATVKFGVIPRGEGDIPMELKEQLEESEFKGKITSLCQLSQCIQTVQVCF